MNDVLINLKHKNQNQCFNEDENLISLKAVWDNNSAVLALYAQNQLKESQDDKEKSIRLSLESGVLSKYTSYVAVSRISYIENIQIMNEEDEILRYSGPLYEDNNDRYSQSIETLQLLQDNIILWKSQIIEELRNEYRIEEKYDIYDKNESEEVNTEISQKEKNEFKILQKEISPIDIMKLQNNDGFWDIPTVFIYKKTGGKIPEIDLGFSDISPIIKKRVVSTIFCLGYLYKFDKDGSNKWIFEKNKSLEWLKKINSKMDWERIVEESIPDIIK